MVVAERGAYSKMRGCSPRVKPTISPTLMFGEIIVFYHHEDDNMGSSPICNNCNLLWGVSLGRPKGAACDLLKSTAIVLSWRREGSGLRLGSAE